MNYFQNCKTVGEIKSTFRKLMMEHHPDRHPADQREAQGKIAAAIIALYHKVLEGMHGTTSHGSDGKDHTYYYSAKNEDAVIDIICDLLKLKMEDVEIQLIGTWVWVTGQTKAYRKELKETGMRWHSKRIAWYWKPYSGRARYQKNASLSELADFYGSKTFRNAPEDREEKGLATS